jgi:hypothetical protein
MSAGFGDVTVATPDEVEAARLVVSNAMSLLDWCAGLNAMLLSDDGETVPVLPEDLREAYRAAVDELRAEHYELADTTFSGSNEQLGFDQVTRILGAVGWTGRLLESSSASSSTPDAQRSWRSPDKAAAVAGESAAAYSVDSSVSSTPRLTASPASPASALSRKSRISSSAQSPPDAERPARCGPL